MGTTVVALDVGASKVAGALVTYEKGGYPPSVSHRLKAPTVRTGSGEAMLEGVVRMACELLDAAQSVRDERALGDVVGIGVGSTGVIDPASGSVRHATDITPGWMGMPLCRRLSEATGLPAAALGDVQAHALGEVRWGVARGAHSALCVGIGTGLGGAYVLDGRVLQGFRGAAGHFGHSIHPAAVGTTCACGAVAHVESVASGTAIAACYQGRSFADELDPSLMGDEVARRAEAGELEALAIMERAGFALGEAIGSWCNLFDPELVVLSGSVTGAGHAWHAALDRGFKSQALEPLLDTPILFAALGGDAPLVGAAEHLMDSAGVQW